VIAAKKEQKYEKDSDDNDGGFHAGRVILYAFYRSMDAYRNVFQGKNDLMLLEPNSDFFRYLRDSMGRAPAAQK